MRRVLLALLVGCTTLPAATTSYTTATTTTPFAGPPADLTDPDVVLHLSSLSGSGISRRLLSLSAASNTPSDCPLVDNQDLAHVIVTGGCTDENGLEWFGTLRSDAVYTEGS